MPRSPTAGNRGNGGKWIRPEKRRRIYERDGWCCVWCLTPVGPKAGMTRDVATLDHVVPRSQGGTNDAHNLVTCCARCNSMRRERSMLQMAHELTALIGPGGIKIPQWVSVVQVLMRVLDAIERPLPS